MIKVMGLRTEHLENPIGLDAGTPRLSWKIDTDQTDVLQETYQVQCTGNNDFKELVWDSGKVAGDVQRILYSGHKLRSAERIYWRVKVWSNRGESEFSEPATFEMGLLEPGDWAAKWIEPEGEVDPDAVKPAPFIRKEFYVKKGLLSARAYLTAKGVYTFSVNGKAGTQNLFNPGYTSYYQRLQYQTYDITDLLQEGVNTLGVILGDGWWRGHVGIIVKNSFGYKLAFLGQIMLCYQDGSSEMVASDGSYKTTVGPILKSDFKFGEWYDARKEMHGWDGPGFDDTAWNNVYVTQDGLEHLTATRSVPVRCMERFSPRVIRTPNGETVLDFGQNISGRVELKVMGEAGAQVVLIHGETLDKEGNFTLENLIGESDGEFQQVRYTLKGEGLEIYSPYFTTAGFRYVLVKEYPGEVKEENFTAVAIYSAMEETGWFECSSKLINQLVNNTRWSQKGNFMDIPTDCPTRERAGWTGDAQLFCKTASDFMNVYPFFEKWMADVAAEQLENGSVLSTVPEVLGLHNPIEMKRMMQTLQAPLLKLLDAMKNAGGGISEGSAGWGDAAVIIPWTMYLCYGDKKILENQYASAKAWVDYMDACAKDSNENYKDQPAYHTYTDGEPDANYIWDTRFHFGEWLETDEEPRYSMEELGKSFMQKMILSDPPVATAYYAYSTRLLSEMAAILGKKEDEQHYTALYRNIKRVYNKYFIHEDGTILEGRQAPNVRTLAFDLADDGVRQRVADKLADMVKENGDHLNTGFLSTPFILKALTDFGHTDTAFRLLEQETSPSWLYAVTKGATTVWESWRGITPEGDVYKSLNHYSYGAVCDFLFSYIAGIQPIMEAPGYKRFIIKPLPGGTLEYAKASFESPYGTIESGWEKMGGGIRYRFKIPANTQATVMLPGYDSDLEKVFCRFKDAKWKDGRIVFEAGNGEYCVTI